MTVSRQVLVPYDELEIRLIEAVAAVAAPVLASAQRQSDGVRRQQGATELSRLAGSLTQSLSARTVGERLVQAIIPLVHGVDAAFWDATGRLTIPGSGPLALLREPCDPRVERVVELVRSAEHRFWTPDLTNDRRLAQPESSHAEEPPEPHAVLVVPVRIRESFLGVLVVAGATGRAFTEADAELAQERTSEGRRRWPPCTSREGAVSARRQGGLGGCPLVRGLRPGRAALRAKIA